MKVLTATATSPPPGFSVRRSFSAMLQAHLGGVYCIIHLIESASLHWNVPAGGPCMFQPHCKMRQN